MREDDRDDRDEEDAVGSPISTSTLDVWVAAVMELYRGQCSMRKNGLGRRHWHPGAGLLVAVRGDVESLCSGRDFLGPESPRDEGLWSAGGGGPRGLGKAGEL
jgi:hypothetical protein